MRGEHFTVITQFVEKCHFKTHAGVINITDVLSNNSAELSHLRLLGGSGWEYFSWCGFVVTP